MTRSFFAALVCAIAIVLGGAPSSAQNAYIANDGDNTVSVIATATNTVVGLPIPVGSNPAGVAVTPDGGDNTVSVIATATNTVTATIPIGDRATGVAVTPDGSKVYVANGRGLVAFSAGVSVIATATDTVVGLPIRVGPGPAHHWGMAVTPDGSKVYVANSDGNTVSVIATATNTVVGLPIPVGSGPYGVSVTPDGRKVYVVNSGDNTVSVIDPATNMVVAVLPVGNGPGALGVFIQPRFAGTPGNSNCPGQSVSALAQTFGGLNGAAIALGFPTVQGLQTAVNAFCGAQTM